MTDTDASGAAESRDSWAAQVAALDGSRDAPRARKEPLSVERILAAAFQIVEAEGFDALTMRRVAGALQTGPASLYAHVRNKAELDGLMIGALSARVTLSAPDRAHWRAQFIDVCSQLRDLYLRYPGISGAAVTAVPTNLDTLRLAEGMLGILLAGGIAPQSAAWTIDAAFLYVGAYSFEASTIWRSDADADGRVVDRAEIRARLGMLPMSLFPHTVAYAQELTSGDGHERFDFTLGLFLDGLRPESHPSGTAEN